MPDFRRTAHPYRELPVNSNCAKHQDAGKDQHREKTCLHMIPGRFILPRTDPVGDAYRKADADGRTEAPDQPGGRGHDADGS